MKSETKKQSDILNQYKAQIGSDQAQSVVDIAQRMREQGQAASTALQTEHESKGLLDIVNTEYPDLVYPIEGLVCEGLTLFAGASKQGKSRIVLHMCMAVSAGRSFWGRKTIQGDVLYYALEDSERRIKDRSVEFSKVTGIPVLNTLRVRTKQTTVKGGILDDINSWLDTHPNARLIVIDTLQKVRDLYGGNTNAYAADVAFMSPFQDIASKRNIAIIMVHHLNKRTDSGDAYDRISGSTGLMATADTTIMLTSKRDKTQGAVQFTGRDVFGDDIPLVYKDGLWHALNEDDIQRQDRKNYEEDDIIRLIKEILRLHPNGVKMSYDEVLSLSVNRLGVIAAINTTQLAKHIRAQAERLFNYDGIVVTTGESIGGSARGIQVMPKRVTITQTSMSDSSA